RAPGRTWFPCSVSGRSFSYVDVRVAHASSITAICLEIFVPVHVFGGHHIVNPRRQDPDSAFSLASWTDCLYRPSPHIRREVPGAWENRGLICASAMCLQWQKPGSLTPKRQ
ncbi:hypothetical protein CORC01_06270, partial [Colletotrichum orchidophilum]